VVNCRVMIMYKLDRQYVYQAAKRSSNTTACVKATGNDHRVSTATTAPITNSDDALL